MPISAVPSLPLRTYSCSSVYWRSFGMFATGAPLRGAGLTVGREVYGRLKTESRNPNGRLYSRLIALKGAPQRIDIALQIFQRAVVVDAVVGACPLELGRHLRGDHVHGVGLLETAGGDQTLESHWSRRIYQHDAVILLDEI